STPAVVDGTSIDTLSVSISNRLSPGLIASPADLNHFVILPSATVSPSCGISTSMACSLDPFPDHFARAAEGAQDEPIAGELIAAQEGGSVAGLYAGLPMVGDCLRLLVDRIGPEIGDVAVDGRLRLLRRRPAARLAAHHIGCHLHAHIAARIVVDDPVRPGDRLAIDLGSDVTPRAEQALGPFSIGLALCAHHVTEMYCVSRNSIRPSC